MHQPALQLNQPAIALDGIGGVYNYGCEAIVRGTHRILRTQWPNGQTCYCSPRLEQDGLALQDLDIRLVVRQPETSLPERIRLKLARSFGFQAERSVRSRFPWCRNVDAVLEIGGDILTLGPGSETAQEFPQVKHLNTLLRSGKPIVLWGASVGPFDGNPHAEAAFSAVLKRLALITVREPETIRYLATLGITDNVVAVADPAFLMAAAPAEDPEIQPWLPRPGKRTIGLNLSPLSIFYQTGSRQRGHDLAEQHATTLAELISRHDSDILLIPHVISPHAKGDDDPSYLSAVYERLPAACRQRVRLLPNHLGAMRTKTILAACTAVVAARMHCAIGALSSNTPTLFLSYSAKAVGMCEFVYGNHDFVLPVDSDQPVLLDHISRLLNRQDALRRHLESRQADFQAKALAAGTALASLFSRHRPQRHLPASP